jgi:hypothetical protein
MKAAGVVGAIVQAITGLDGRSYTRQQLDALQRNSLRMKGYVWCFPGSSVASRLTMFDGYPLEDLCLDVEDPAGNSIDDVDRDFALCDAYIGREAMMYTAYWYFKQRGWLRLMRWAQRRLWEALYNLDPSLGAGFVPYAGWTLPAAHQFDAHWRGIPGRELDISAMA